MNLVIPNSSFYSGGYFKSTRNIMHMSEQPGRRLNIPDKPMYIDYACTIVDIDEYINFRF